MLKNLNDDERHLIELYYSGAGKTELAKQHGISLAALYNRVKRNQQKLKDNL